MYHQHNAFSRPPIDEWLVYFKRSWKAFSVWITSDEGEHYVSGQYSYYSSKIFLSLQLDFPGESVSLDLKVDRAGPLRNRLLLGNSPLVGNILSAGTQDGSCIVQNSHDQDTPLVWVKIQNPHCVLEAYREQPGLVECPILVFGIENCEMILESYYMLGRASRRALPQNKLRRHFVGSCRSVRYSRDYIADALVGIVVIVAVVELVVKDDFMRTGP